MQIELDVGHEMDRSQLALLPLIPIHHTVGIYPIAGMAVAVREAEETGTVAVAVHFMTTEIDTQALFDLGLKRAVSEIGMTANGKVDILTLTCVHAILEMTEMPVTERHGRNLRGHLTNLQQHQRTSRLRP